MGCYVETRDTDCFIEMESWPAAGDALTKRALEECEGGRSSGWRLMLDARRKASKARERALPYLIHGLGFDCYVHSDGALEIQGYDSKSWIEEEAFEVLAPYIAAGSYIEWEGEERELYRWEFDGIGMEVKYGSIVWA